MEVSWAATHEGDEEDMVDVDDGVEGHETVYEVPLPFLDANAQEEHAEREFKEDGRSKVKDFFYNDPLEFISSVKCRVVKS